MENDGCRTPGQLVAKLLLERHWSQRLLAVILQVNETIISKIISGQRAVDAQLALAFEEVFEVDADRFLELQRSYDLARARIVTRPDPDRATRATLFGGLPIAEMMKRGWLDVNDIKNSPQVEAALIKFFGADSLRDIEILPHAAKKTHVATDVTPVQMAWIYRVRQIADEMLVGQYSEFAVRSALKKLEVLMTAPEEARKVPRILAESGIRFVIVESLASAKIDGVCFWLDDKSPVIGMTLRYDRIDNFWFVLRHEMEHVLRLHGRAAAMLDVELEDARAGIGDNIPEEERVANEAAGDFGLSRKTLSRFIERKSPFFNERDLLGFANALQIHPGIAAGRLHYETGRYDLFRNHLAKIKSHVAPSAIVDGWGDVAPVNRS